MISYMRLICLVMVFLLPMGSLSVASDADIKFYSIPGSKAPFSSAVRVGDIIYLSGQIGFTSDGKLPEDIKAQAKAVMDNVASAAAMAGATMDDIFKCTIMIDDISRWAEFNKVYVAYFKPGRLPARSAFGAEGLAFGAAFEVECMAYLSGEKK